METKDLLTLKREATKAVALKEFNKTEEDLERDIGIMRDWLKTQKHLPEVPNDNIIMNFLLLNKFSIEITKEKIDMYYTIRSLVPEIFENKHPRMPFMKEVSKVIQVIPLPKVTDDFKRVSIQKLISSDVDKFEFYNYVAHVFQKVEIKLNEEVVNGDIVIYDMKNFAPMHVSKLTPIGIRKSAVVLEKVYSNRIAQMHIVNCPSYAETSINLIKSVLKPKLAARLHVHNNSETLLKILPKRILPRDYGGDELSLDELSELWEKKLEEYYDRFDALEKMRVNEFLRPTPLVNDEVLGFHGNFKKLSVD